jgi:hypothetical protein
MMGKCNRHSAGDYKRVAQGASPSALCNDVTNVTGGRPHFLID